MMGIRQQFKHGAEYDVVYARDMYCYLVNKPQTVNYWKRAMRRRRRRERKQELQCAENI